MEKKKYTAPKMEIIQMKAQNALLSFSGDDAPEAVEYDDEFGFNAFPGMDRKA